MLKGVLILVCLLIAGCAASDSGHCDFLHLSACTGSDQQAMFSFYRADPGDSDFAF